MLTEERKKEIEYFRIEMGGEWELDYAWEGARVENMLFDIRKEMRALAEIHYEDTHQSADKQLVRLVLALADKYYHDTDTRDYVAQIVKDYESQPKWYD